MLTVEGFRRPGRGVFRHPAAEVVVRDPHGNVVAIVMWHGGEALVTVAGDDDFEEAVRALGQVLTVKDIPLQSG
jgi:hypothetical protein